MQISTFSGKQLFNNGGGGGESAGANCTNNKSLFEILNEAFGSRTVKSGEKKQKWFPPLITDNCDFDMLK